LKQSPWRCARGFDSVLRSGMQFFEKQRKK
jgi:hypothetical protein